MNSEFLNQIAKPDASSTEKFQHLNDFLLIDIPCIFCNNKKVYPQDIYNLVDFNDNGFEVQSVKFFDAYRRGFTLTIVVLNMETGELLKRSHRLGDDSTPCDWALIEFNYFNPKDIDRQSILDYCKSKPQHDN